MRRATIGNIDVSGNVDLLLEKAKQEFIFTKGHILWGRKWNEDWRESLRQCEAVIAKVENIPADRLSDNAKNFLLRVRWYALRVTYRLLSGPQPLPDGQQKLAGLARTIQASLTDEMIAKDRLAALNSAMCDLAIPDTESNLLRARRKIASYRFNLICFNHCATA
jgi:hypothetical protein